MCSLLGRLTVLALLFGTATLLPGGCKLECRGDSAGDVVDEIGDEVGDAIDKAKDHK